MSGGSSTGSYAADWLVNPLSELELGAALTFVTAPESMLRMDNDGALRFTDLGIFSAGARYSFAKRFELAGGASLLAKQPSYLDEPVFSGGNLALRFALAEKWALWAQGAGGPLLADLGGWGTAATGLQARTRLDRTIQVQAALGGSATKLFMGDDSGRPWFGEVSAHGETVLRTPRGETAGWIGVDYRVPVYHDDGNLDIDPQIRLNFEVGLMLGYVDNWDLSMVYTLIDRGDYSDPATTLPMLDGGFDQQQLMFAASRRFELADDEDKEDVRKWIAE